MELLSKNASPLFIIPFKPFPMGKKRLRRAVNSDDLVIRIQKSLVNTVIRTIESLVLIKSMVILTPIIDQISEIIDLKEYDFLSIIGQNPDEPLKKSLGEQIREIVIDLEMYPVVVVMSDLVNLLPSTLKAVIVLLKEYDGVVVPTNDGGTGILGFNKQLINSLDYFGVDSSKRFYEKWSDIPNIKVAKFLQQPILVDVDDEKDLSFLKWDWLEEKNKI